MKKLALTVIVILITIFSLIFFLSTHNQKNLKEEKAFATKSYACEAGDEFVVQYFEGPKAPPQWPGERPNPTGHVIISIPGGQILTLQQTISGSGVRYANADESAVFWNKGIFGLFAQHTSTPRECMEVQAKSEQLPEAYASSSLGISVRLPAGYIIDGAYRNTTFGSRYDIHGVKFTVPELLARGTNLSTDSYVAVEEMRDVDDCNASKFLTDGARAETLTEGGITYSVASSTGAGAGNRYEEWVYAFPNSMPCKAVHYLIHYSVFENYPPDTVKEFDKMAILHLFDIIRRAVTINN